MKGDNLRLKAESLKKSKALEGERDQLLAENQKYALSDKILREENLRLRTELERREESLGNGNESKFRSLQEEVQALQEYLGFTKVVNALKGIQFAEHIRTQVNTIETAVGELAAIHSSRNVSN